MINNDFRIINENESISLVQRAVQCGVNYIDTSPYYGHTYSETLIGKVRCSTS